jgi:hypothetical protein
MATDLNKVMSDFLANPTMNIDMETGEILENAE